MKTCIFIFLNLSLAFSFDAQQCLNNKKCTPLYQFSFVQDKKMKLCSKSQSDYLPLTTLFVGIYFLSNIIQK